MKERNKQAAAAAATESIVLQSEATTLLRSVLFGHSVIVCGVDEERKK